MARVAVLLALTLTLVACARASEAPSGVAAFSNSAAVAPLQGLEAFTRVYNAPDEVSVFIVYDSADVNAYRVGPNLAKAAESLDAFGRFYAVDIRDPELAWVLDSWNVQILPAIRGLSPQRATRAEWQKTALDGVGGIRSLSEMPHDRGFSESALKKFVLGLQGDTAVARIETENKATALHERATSGKEARPTVVLVSNKPTTSQLVKAVAIELTGRVDFYDVFTNKAKNAQKLFGVSKVPTLLIYDAKGQRHEYTGPLKARDIVTFFEKHTVDREFEALRRAQSEGQLLEREVRRHAEGALRVASPYDWNVDVVQRQSITGVFVVESETEAAAVADAVRDFRKQAGERTAVGQFVWLLRSDAPALARQLTEVEQSEPAKGAFISAKKNVLTKYFGDISGAALADFVNGALQRGVGAVSYKELPGYGQS